MTRSADASVSPAPTPGGKNGARAETVALASLLWRPVGSRDHADVAAIVHAAFGSDGAESLGRCLAIAPELAICCDTGQARIAACFGYPRPGCEQTVILEGIAVVPEWRSRGIGSGTVEQFECACRDSHYTSIMLCATEDVSAHFYVPRGYEVVAPAPADGLHVILVRHL